VFSLPDIFLACWLIFQRCTYGCLDKLNIFRKLLFLDMILFVPNPSYSTFLLACELKNSHPIQCTSLKLGFYIQLYCVSSQPNSGKIHFIAQVFVIYSDGSPKILCFRTYICIHKTAVMLLPLYHNDVAAATVLLLQGSLAMMPVSLATDG